MIYVPLVSVHELLFLAPGISMVILSLVASIIRDSGISSAPIATGNFGRSGL